MKQVRAILSEEGLSDAGLMLIVERMCSLVARCDEVLPAETAKENEPGLKPIYINESGLLLAYGIVRPEQPTPIHSHGTWGVVGVYRGRDRYQIWRRHDEHDGPGPAEVRLVDELILGPGDAIVIPPPPHDIHVQQAMRVKWPTNSFSSARTSSAVCLTLCSIQSAAKRLSSLVGASAIWSTLDNWPGSRPGVSISSLPIFRILLKYLIFPAFGGGSANFNRTA